jgi:hypothetical protein
MAWNLNTVRRTAIALFVGLTFGVSLSAQSSSLTRIALFDPVGNSKDSTLAAVLSTVTDSVELSLDVLQRYDVKRLPAADPSTGLDEVRAYCEANRVDQAILGSGAARAAGGYDFRLVVYDRRKDSITVDQKATSTGVLDIFDTTDALIASLLEGLSGTHLLFGSLTVETDPAGATIAVNGKKVGASPVSLRGLPVGTIQVSAHSDGREDVVTSVTIVDGQSADQALTLVRSAGTLSVKAPADAVITVRSAELGEKGLTGTGTLSLPTGEYEVVATDAGLPTVPTKLTISRNQTSPWQPWTKAYLAIQPATADVEVQVDGRDRGAAPQLVEVEPVALHRLELKKEHYQVYRADLSVTAGDKAVFAPELTENPGSIKIVTSIPGVEVDLDGKQKTITPAVFENVAAGTHVVHLGSLSALKRVYLGGDPFPVEVKPDEQTPVARTMVEGNGHLTITDAPTGSSLEIDGVPVESAEAFTSGMEAPAGELDVAVNGPGGQKWTKTVNLGLSGDVKESIYSMAWHLQRRTIQMDGNPGDWEGLMPVWIPERQTFPDQPGTELVRGFACRDDSYLYVRFEFGNGTPRTDLVKAIASELDYVATIYTRSGPIQATTRFRRSQAGGAASLSIYDPHSQTTKGLGENAFKSQIGESSLEIAIPFRLIKSYLSDGVVNLALNVVNVGTYGWLDSIQTGQRQAAFDF